MLGARKMVWALIAALVTTMALAAPPPGKGGGGGGGGGPGGGGGNGGGGGGGGDTKDVFAEMVLIDRDINGVPILTEGLTPGDEWGDVPQPIMFGDKEGCDLVFNDLDGVASDSIYAALDIDARYIPFVDGEIPEDDKLCMTEAELGRLSVARAPKFVSDRGLYELVATLSMSDLPIGVDEAGRLVVSYYAENEEGEEFLEVLAIDAPLQNLGGFEGILTTAKLSHEDVNDGEAVELPIHPGHDGETEAIDLMDRAAAMLGAAADKFGHVGLDQVVYITQILGLTGDMTSEAEDLFGTLDDEGFFDFRAFEYNRAATYNGDICYLKVVDPVEPPGEATLPYTIKYGAQVVREPILELVFPWQEVVNTAAGFSQESTAEYDYTGFTGSNVWAFSQAVDDARAVIYWVHEHPVPVELLKYCELSDAGGSTD